jgi:exosortase H (IPTLxxWG-CTERM-specific)
VKFKLLPSKGDPGARQRSFGFLLRFVLFLVVFYFLVAAKPVNDHVIVPFTGWIASASGTVLNALGEKATVQGTEIQSGSFGVNIENGCNGIETALLLAAAVLAFPAGWRQRLTGFLLGFLGIQVLNLIRVVSLVWIGRHRPALFDSSHTVIWQSAVVLFGVLIFLFWASRQRPRPANAEEKAGRCCSTAGPPSGS